MARRNSLIHFSEKRNPGKLLILGFLLFLILPGCSAPPLPFETRLAESQSNNLWKAQVHLYAPDEYKTYVTTYRGIKDDLIMEESRFIWFRNYKPIETKLSALLKYGEGVLKKVEDIKETKRTEIGGHLSELEKQISSLDRLSLSINEGRIVRRSLTKAGLLAHEADFFLNNGDFDTADSRLKLASGYIKSTEDGMFSILGRYNNTAFLEKWKRWVNEVVAESREEKGVAIVVSKIDRSLTIYMGGKPYKTYGIGLGRNGFHDKISRGDGATPEGCYRITKKLDQSKYYKALLINYPNEEDMQEFAKLKKKGIIPKQTGIGGLIEIHGGGKDGMTYGCVSLDDEDMDEVFRIATPGTPVAIVGATSHKMVF